MKKEKTDQEVQKFNNIKAKVLTLGRISLMLKNVKDSKDVITKAKEELKTNKLPPGILGFNSKDATIQLESFINVKDKDEANEKFPVTIYKRRQSEIMLKRG